MKRRLFFERGGDKFPLDDDTILYIIGTQLKDEVHTNRTFINNGTVFAEKDGIKALYFTDTKNFYYPTDPNMNFKNDFTIEFLANVNKVNNTYGGSLRTNGVIGSTWVGVMGEGKCCYGFGANDTYWHTNYEYNIPVPWKANEWFHIAFQRKSGILEVFFNGKKVYTKELSIGELPGKNDPCFLGEQYNSGGLDGYLAHIRYSKIARYETNFTLSEFPFKVD